MFNPLGQIVDPFQQVFPLVRISRIFHPHVAFDEDPGFGSGVADPPVGFDLIRIGWAIHSPDGFSHWDSAGRGSANVGVAARMAAAVAPIIGAASADVVEVPVAQQRNGSDCGVYAMWYAGAVARAVLAGDGALVASARDTSAAGAAAAAKQVAALRDEMRRTAVKLGLPTLRG